jgi:ATP-dependent Clp protease ATP-binding subunit ClpA
VEEMMRSTMRSSLAFLIGSFWALCWMTQSSDAFLPPSLLSVGAAVKRSSFQTSPLHVFERMSEECVAAIITAQEQTNKLQKPLVSNEAMLAGCIDHPGTAALERTLQQYRITWRQMQRTMQELYGEDNESKNDAKDAQGAGWLSGFRAAKEQEDRPFGADLKLTLKRAGGLADQMGSTTVYTHHVFLALLQYQETADDRATAATVDQNTKLSDCGPWNLLMEMRTFDTDTVTALEICQSLLKNLEEQQAEQQALTTNSKELVTGVGDSSSKTPTLADCGTDLTKLARDGLLDPVYGREKETRSCIRTLMRRRKNNVCLIGEAGVGKVSGKEDQQRFIS